VLRNLLVGRSNRPGPIIDLKGDALKRQYPAQPIIGVGAVILHKGKLVLIKRGSEPGKNKWSIPGGLVELGETIVETTVREVEEETGLKVEVQRLLDTVDNIEYDEGGRLRYHFVIIDFLAFPRSGSLKAGSDVLEARWIPLSEAEDYDLTGTFRKFLQRNEDTLRNLSPTK
jgi:8-oxo-dGTP diphosphatase